MVSEKIIKAILEQSPKNNKDKVITMLIKNVSSNTYNDDVVNHILEMLVDTDAIISVNDINVNAIRENPKIILYNANEYDFKDIKVVGVDNISGITKITYNYKLKNEQDWKETNSHVSFIDYPIILK